MATGATKSVIDVAIVGGGAAGLATAIFVARRNPALRVVVLDGAKKLGAKILISGGGRCNVTNDFVTPNDFWGGSRHVIRRVLDALPVAQTVAFFREIGVSLHVEPGGKMFPDTNKARTVLDALLGEAGRCGVEIRTEHRVTAVERRDERFTISSLAGAVSARNVVLATGGRSVPKTGSDGFGYRLAESLGHSLVPQMPALVALVIDGDFHSALSGVSQDVELTVRVQGLKPVRLQGALLWTHFGVSGPVVLNASRHWHAAMLYNRSVTMSINMLRADSFDSADRRLMELAAAQPRAALHNAVANLIPARVAHALTERLALNSQIPIGQLSRDARRKLVQALIDWPLPVRDSRGYQYAEVTAGGMPLDEIDPRTMESRRCPGLFLVGEILDVDGRIGGFNFQWAWSSAWVAAAAIASSEI
jgi:predicted Rossmann fold flavoprotein